MKNEEVERLRQRAVALGNEGSSSSRDELAALLKSEYPAVRRAAASALGKVIDCNPSLAELASIPLAALLKTEESPQVLQYAIKSLSLCTRYLNQLVLDDLEDIARDPNRKAYVRNAANDLIAAIETEKAKKEGLKKHWCSRCRRIVTPEESEAAIAKYGKPYCRHCLTEKELYDARFDANVEAAKRLRTVDDVAVQSQGERRIGNWLAAHGIAYEYDERFLIARDTRIRPDFYLPEHDLYIEYWGMDTPEYVENMRKKRFLYQRARKKLISLSFRELPRLESALGEKLSRYLNLHSPDTSDPCANGPIRV